MIVIATFALGLAVVVGGFRLRERRRFFLSQASAYAEMESIHRGRVGRYRRAVEVETKEIDVLERNRNPTALTHELIGRTRASRDEHREKLRDSTLKADRYEMLHQKYLSAAERPWSTIEVDPPGPN